MFALQTADPVSYVRESEVASATPVSPERWRVVLADGRGARTGARAMGEVGRELGHAESAAAGGRFLAGSGGVSLSVPGVGASGGAGGAVFAAQRQVSAVADGYW